MIVDLYYPGVDVGLFVGAGLGDEVARWRDTGDT